MVWQQIAQLIAILTGLLAAVTLFYGSLGIPWESQSWSGESPREKALKRRNQVLAWVGLPALFISGGCQLAVTLWPLI